MNEQEGMICRQVMMLKKQSVCNIGHLPGKCNLCIWVIVVLLEFKNKLFLLLLVIAVMNRDFFQVERRHVRLCFNQLVPFLHLV